MASARKVAANRRTAARSTGPRTPKGKSVAALNALRHGVLSRSPVIEGVESEAEWREHLDATVAAFEPQGYLELELARRMALQTWKLERLRRHETALAKERMANIRREELCGGQSLMAAMMDGFLEAARDREAFEALTMMKPFESVPAPLAIRILKRITEVSGLKLDEEKLAAASGEESAADAEETRWSAPDVVQLAHEIAEQGATRPDIALMLSVNSSTHGWDSRMARLRELREQRLLPEGPDLAVLQRYESELERSLYRALHEIERLQAHRNGGEVPVPAVLDVTVEAGPTAA